jgi:hypothetical protein
VLPALRLEVFADGDLREQGFGDEIGHVGFIVARLGERGRAGMRRLYVRMASTFASESAEMVALFGRGELARRFSAFHLAEAAAELPSLAFAAALI